MTIQQTILALSDALSKVPSITAICMTDDPATVDRAGGDIDIFVYSEDTVVREQKLAAYSSVGLEGTLELEKYDSPDWGKIDFTEIGGIEACVMYFREADALRGVDDVREGKRSTNESGYYPTGRLPLFQRAFVLYDRDGFIAGIRDRIVRYPAPLKKRILEACVWRLREEENPERGRDRKDVLFFHTAIENAIDIITQLLFALNETYMPSRKRNAIFSVTALR